jgi:UDPglucose 6-dehydrogenase
MTIGVIGCGVVGSAVADGFEARGAKVRRYDKFKQGINDVSVIMTTDVVFVCVPTATNEDGSQDLEALEEVFALLRGFSYQGVIVVKSTVLPGTTERFAKKWRMGCVVHNPEFLTAAKPFEDFINQPAIILGSTNPEAAMVAVDLYHACGFKNVKVAHTPTETEMAKYFHNLFLSAKVSFCNEVYEVCQYLDINYNVIREMAVLMGGIGQGHTKVPGHDGPGFSGMCFPKDTKAFLTYAKNQDLKMDVLEATVEGNNRRRKGVA